MHGAVKVPVQTWPSLAKVARKEYHQLPPPNQPDRRSVCFSNGASRLARKLHVSLSSNSGALQRRRGGAPERNEKTPCLSLGRAWKPSRARASVTLALASLRTFVWEPNPTDFAKVHAPWACAKTARKDESPGIWRALPGGQHVQQPPILPKERTVPGENGGAGRRAVVEPLEAPVAQSKVAPDEPQHHHREKPTLSSRQNRLSISDQVSRDQGATKAAGSRAEEG